MFAELTTAASSIKIMGELLLLIHKTKVSEAVTEKAIQLNTLILSLQESCATLRSEHEEMKSARDALAAKIIKIENWTAEAAKYELLKAAPGFIVYAPKPHVESAEPFHWLCANCYVRQEKSFLQKASASRQGVVYKRFSCSFQVTTHGVFDITSPHV